MLFSNIHILDEQFQHRSGCYVGIRDGIIAYISDNLDKPLNAETIAAHFSLSKSYVQNIFTQKMHIGLKKYIMQKKIYAAHADMIAGMTPNEVCEKYKFGDYSLFYRTYKKTFGNSPRDIK